MKSECALAHLFFDETTDQLRDYASNAPAGSRARGTSMGGLYVAATLQAPLLLVGQRLETMSAFRLASQGPPLLYIHRCEAPRAPVITSMLCGLVRKGYGSGFRTPAT